MGDVRQRLLDEFPFYAPNCLKILDTRRQMVPFELKEPQLRLDRALEEQRAAGKPMRAIILKARKIGFSTYAQGKIIHRVTTKRHRKGLVVAQDHSTAGELFEIGDTMYVNLPPDPEANLKPPIANRRRGRLLKFGEPSAILRDQGYLGLNSSFETDTANEFEAGRGYTYTDVHASEVAFWADVRKLTSLLNAVPDEPDTLAILESTANGHNHFKKRWDQAVAGVSGYVPIFCPWWEEPAYRIEFDTEEDREDFIATIGSGPFGEDEPRLVERYGCTPEQLAWRRLAIVDKCDSDLETFKQEYPASPAEAFRATGRTVFSGIVIERVLEDVETTDPSIPSDEFPGPDYGLFIPGAMKTTQTRHGTVTLPTSTIWVPAEKTEHPKGYPFWRRWEEPVTDATERAKDEDKRLTPKHYLIAGDPASGEDNGEGELAFHAAQVLNHETGEQIAEYDSRIDPTDFAEQLLLAALYYGEPWLAVERTGGWGLPVLRWLWMEAGYSRLYFTKAQDRRQEKQADRLGWDTTPQTKKILEANGKDILKGQHGLRSRKTADQLTTHVMDERGRTGPESGAFNDLLMAWLIGQHLCNVLPVLKPRRPKPPPPIRTSRKLRY